MQELQLFSNWCEQKTPFFWSYWYPYHMEPENKANMREAKSKNRDRHDIDYLPWALYPDLFKLFPFTPRFSHLYKPKYFLQNLIYAKHYKEVCKCEMEFFLGDFFIDDDSKIQ